jgi:redox-sensitive bicupin YhaK (pirin superfamily)
MEVATGTVVDGKIVVEGLHLLDGQTVVVLTRGSESDVELSADQEAELLEAIAEADRGDTISANELLLRLQRHG